jgi:peptidoglycan hydrolase-like protein with peptidoglycan-binding domain
MNLRDLMNKIAEAEAPAAAPAVWSPSPEQASWLGGANQQDPYILSRMPGQKPPISWFKDPADQELAKRMGFPAAPAAAPAAQTAQAAADDQGLASAREKMKQLMALLAKAKLGEKRTVDQLKATQDIAASGLEEGINADIARQLIESFGYTQEQLDELSMQDVGDFGRGAWQGATLGAGSNISAGAKSLFKGTKYKDELAGELKANQDAEKRSPLAYGAGNVAGAIGSSFAIPGAGVGNLAARGAAKLGAGALGQGVARAAGQVGTNLAIQKGVDTALDAHNKDVLGTTQQQQPGSAATGKTDPKLAQLQKVIGAKPDGVMGPETKQKLAAWQQSQGIKADGIPGPETFGKAGIKESAAEQYARLRDMLEAMEAEERTDEGVWDTVAKGAMNLGRAAKIGATGEKVINPATGKMVSQSGKVFQKALAGQTPASKAAYKVGQTAGAAGAKVAGAAKAAGGAMARNPVKTALGTAAGAYGLSQLGGADDAQQPSGSPTGNTTPQGGGQSGNAPTTTTPPQGGAGVDQATLDQINQLMSELSQYDIPEIQQGLVQARAQLAQVTGDANIGSADKAAPAAK